MIPEAKELFWLKCNHSRGDGFAGAKLYTIENNVGLWRRLTDVGADVYKDDGLIRAGLGELKDVKLYWFVPFPEFHKVAIEAGYIHDVRADEPTEVG